jgi:hypothetical protein
MTTETTTPAHEKAVKVHTRRAVNALAEAQNELHKIGRKLAEGTAEANDARKAAELLSLIAGHLGALEALRDITEGEKQ